MSLRTILIVVLALVFGGSAAIGINAVRNQQGGGNGNIDMVPVVVAARDIPPHIPIVAEMLTVRDCPSNLVPKEALHRLEDVVERAALTPVVKDEWLIDSKLSPKGTGYGMAGRVRTGMLAYTIQTSNEAAGVAGFVLPGNKVDVFLSGNTSGFQDPGTRAAATILECIEVLAVHQSTDAPTGYKMDVRDLRSVTLLVTQEQAAVLAHAQSRGVLHLALRNGEDKTVASIKPPVAPIKPTKAPPQPPTYWYIDTLRGPSQSGTVVLSPATNKR